MAGHAARFNPERSEGLSRQRFELVLGQPAGHHGHRDAAFTEQAFALGQRADKDAGLGAVLSRAQNQYGDLFIAFDQGPQLGQQIAFLQDDVRARLGHAFDIFSQTFQIGFGLLDGLFAHGFADAQPVFEPALGLRDSEDGDSRACVARAPGCEVRRRPALFRAVGDDEEFAGRGHVGEAAVFARAGQAGLSLGDRMSNGRQSSEAALATMSDRRNPLSAPKCVTLFDDRLECWTGETLERRIALDQVAQVRLSVEMAGTLTQVVCRVTGPSGEIVFGSRKANNGAFDDNAAEFTPLLVAVHRALKPRADAVKFLEGQSMGFRLIMSGLGLVMALLAAGIVGYFLLVEESAMLAFAGFPFLLIGGYLAWVFKPAGPVKYDPEGLIERFSKSETA